MHFKDTFWYKQRLQENSKPKPIDRDELDRIIAVNRKLLANAKSIVAEGIAKGWLKMPPEKDKRLCIRNLKGVEQSDDQEIF